MHHFSTYFQRNSNHLKEAVLHFVFQRRTNSRLVRNVEFLFRNVGFSASRCDLARGWRGRGEAGAGGSDRERVRVGRLVPSNGQLTRTESLQKSRSTQPTLQGLRDKSEVTGCRQMASLKMTQCLPLVMLTALALHGFAQDTPQAMRAYEIFRELVMRFVDSRPSVQRHIQTLRSMDRLQPAAPAEFPCAAAARAPWRRSAERPTSAHRVRPGDVDVVAAMGDSLSVGYGLAATKLTEVLIEARGWSFSAGGQGTWREFLTLPNILKEFNPNLTGYAVQDALTHQKASRFNVAEGGAISSDLPLQARNLVKRMRADPGVDLQNDWKMVTLMIGSNDFCGFVCLEEDMNATVRRHGEDLERALDHLQASLPRTIVNLIVTPNLESLMNVTHLWPQCYVTHRVECWCLFGSKYKARRREVVKIMRLWQLEERRVATSERYRQKEDFVVNLQPMVEFVVIPKKGNRSDLNFLSEDCFHLSQKGIAMGANGLWMNLLESDDEKSTTFPDPAFSRFLCPTEERPFISTWGNDGGRGPS